MVSAWNTSGVDWSNIYNNRLESIIREFYLIINERDYWMTQIMIGRKTPFVFGQTKAPGLDLGGQFRTSYQWSYICKTLRKWFEYEVYNNYDYLSNGDRYWYTTGCFYVEGSSYTWDGGLFFNGLEWWTCEEGGNLEIEYGDLSFIRDYDNGIYRTIKSEDLIKIYNILNSGLKFRTSRIRDRATFQENTYTIDLTPQNQASSSDYFFQTNTLITVSGEAIFGRTQAYNDYLSNPPTYQSFNNGFPFQRSYSDYETPDRDGEEDEFYTYSHWNNYIKINEGFNNNGYSLNTWNDVDFVNKNYTNIGRERENPGLLYSWDDDSNDLMNGNIDCSILYPQPFSNFGVEDNEIRRRNVLFMDLSSMRGFLKYYTEPDD